MSNIEPKTKHIDYVESWYRVWCPYCDTVNWFCNGNENDITGLDIDAVRCRICKKVFRLGPIDKIEEEIRGDGDIWVENGCKMVEVAL